jgi:hypothetical protein
MQSRCAGNCAERQGKAPLPLRKHQDDQDPELKPLCIDITRMVLKLYCFIDYGPSRSALLFRESTEIHEKRRLEIFCFKVHLLLCRLLKCYWSGSRFAGLTVCKLWFNPRLVIMGVRYLASSAPAPLPTLEQATQTLISSIQRTYT